MECVWIKNGKQLKLNFYPPITSKYEGMLTNHSLEDVYFEFLEDVCGSINNETDCFDSDEVKRIAKCILDLDYDKDRIYELLDSEEELYSLKRVFKAYAEAGASLEAWF